MLTLPEPHDYDPFLSPLHLPVRRWRLQCRFHGATRLPRRMGATPGTLLTGLFRGLLIARGCEESSCHGSDDIELLRSALLANGGVYTPCGIDGESFACRQPDRCPCGTLHRVPCSWQSGRTLPPVVRLSAPELWRGGWIRDWELEITVLGRRAGQHAQEVLTLVRLMGQVGLWIDDRPVTFDVGPMENEEEGVIGAPGTTAAPEMVDTVADRRMLLTFSTPLLLKPLRTVNQRTGRARSLHMRDDALDLSSLLGNLAFDLCALDLDDRAEDTAPPVVVRRPLCEAARDFVVDAAQDLRVLSSHLSLVDLGSRQSRSSEGSFGLQGFLGYVTLKCPSPLAPWLRAMGHWRAGQLGSKGFGEVQIWG